MSDLLIHALRRTAVMVKNQVDLIALEEGCDDDPIGILVEVFARLLAHRVDSVTAHRLALDAVSEAFLADND